MQQYGLGGFLGQAATIAANHAVLLAQLSQLDPRFAMCVAYEDMPPLELPKRGSGDLEEGGGEIESTRMLARLRRFRRPRLLLLPPIYGLRRAETAADS